MGFWLGPQKQNLKCRKILQPVTLNQVYTAHEYSCHSHSAAHYDTLHTTTGKSYIPVQPTGPT